MSRRGACLSGAWWGRKRRVGEESYRNKIIVRVEKTVTHPRVSSLQKLHIMMGAREDIILFPGSLRNTS